jgi:hypothetical protein
MKNIKPKYVMSYNICFSLAMLQIYLLGSTHHLVERRINQILNISSMVVHVNLMGCPISVGRGDTK